MVSKTQKGNYYRNRTKKFLEKDGYTVFVMETKYSIWTPKGVFYKVRDIGGADLMAMNGEEIIFIQVKSNKAHLAAGMKELKKHPYPSCVELWVLYWEPRAREPTIRKL